MTRSIFLGSLIALLGIGGSAIAADGFTPRPPKAATDGAVADRAVDGVPGARNKRGPARSGAESPKAAKRKQASWPDETPTRLKRMHGEMVKELALTPAQAKSLQALMLKQGAERQARWAERKGKGGKKGHGAKQGQGRQERPGAEAKDGRSSPKRSPGTIAAGERTGRRATREANTADQ